jgi:periplasmic divalent cation tolerance protein
MTEIRVVLVTAPEDGAAALGRTLVEEGLVACANVLPGVTSVYRWEGSVQEDSEALIVLKTDGSRIPDLLRRMPELHPYDVPEVLVLDVAAGHPPYLEWVVSESRPPGTGPG